MSRRPVVTREGLICSSLAVVLAVLATLGNRQLVFEDPVMRLEGKIAEQLATMPTRFNYPDSLESLLTGARESISPSYLQRNSIVSVISTGCFTCIEDLNKWNSTMKKLAYSDSLMYLFVALAPTKRYLKRVIDRQVDCSIPIWFDSDGTTQRLNPDLSVPTTILVDKELGILLVGSPASSDGMLDVYNKRLASLFERGHWR